MEQNGYLTGYSVNYSTGAGPWHTVRRVKESRITLSGLQPHKEVVVSVAAVNVNGTGPYTVPLALQTPANSEWGLPGVHSTLLVPTLTYLPHEHNKCSEMLSFNLCSHRVWSDRTPAHNDNH